MSLFLYKKNINHILRDTEFNAHLNKVLNDFYDTQPFCPEAAGTGKAITTCSDNSIFFEIDKKHYLLNWLKEVIEDYCKETNTEIKAFNLDRCWCNRIYHGVQGEYHNHGTKDSNRKVIILYYEVPFNSSKFIVNENTQLGVESGMAIVHDIDMPHSVSKNESKEQRTVFVFDITLEAA